MRKGRGVTSPVLRKCWSVRWSADMASARWRIVLDQPSPAAWPGRSVRGSCGTRPLRQSYITPHCSQCPPVSRKLLLWRSPLRALRVKATGVMQNCLRLVRSHSRRRSPVAFAPYAPPSGSLVAVVAPWHQSGASRCASGQWPAASHVVCAPPTLWASPLRGIGPALVCPSAPKGLPQPSSAVFRLWWLCRTQGHWVPKDMWPLRGHKNKSPEQVRALLTTI